MKLKLIFKLLRRSAPGEAAAEAQKSMEGTDIHMTERTYKTRQRALISDCLRENSSRHLSAREVSELLAARGEPVGLSTVYRCLEHMVGEGGLHRYSSGDSGPACYQYAVDGCHRHYHLRCEECGTLIHLECGELDELFSHLLREHGFAMDGFRTVFYGRCEECAGQA